MNDGPTSPLLLPRPASPTSGFAGPPRQVPADRESHPPGLAIYDTMTYIKPSVSTVCVGAASSMAALLLVGGEAGKRFALPHSSIMIHQPLGGTQGQASDILIYA